jgi:hypothetical protein
VGRQHEVLLDLNKLKVSSIPLLMPGPCQLAITVVQLALLPCYSSCPNGIH